ncbi:PAS domain S-box protein [Fortiea contorta]|uniref:PAS domain S-box protein n=1 Tax=Fortiea contorta TaxID=1892405 RepID=UPI00034D4737|nr:PAS domain S-box protein [Fortiea contorta]
MLLPANENRRLEALYQYQILDTPAAGIFDDLTQMAVEICDTPIAIISLVDSEREWFKSKVGIQHTEVPRNGSFGSYTILETEIFIIPDTLKDERFRNNPLVTANPYCRSYAGVPLVTSNGLVLGSFGIMDCVLRHFTPKEQATLKCLAKQVVRCLELHRKTVIDHHQKQFHLLFANHPKPMWIYDIKTLQILDVNTAAIVDYGYSRAEFLQMRITDVRPPEDVPILLEYLATKHSSLNFSGEWKHRRKNGEIIDVEIFTNTIEYSGHDASLVYIRNITKRKKIEQNLLESEARFRTISQAIPIPLAISRLADGSMLHANQQFMEIFQISSEDLVNYKIQDFYQNPATQKEVLENLAVQGFLHNYEIQFKKLDNSLFWAIISLQYLKYNGEIAILSVLYDITKHKNLEAKLQEQNEFLRTIFENIPLMITLIDVNGRLQWVNQEWERILGFTLQDSQTDDVLAAIYPDLGYRQYVINFIQSAQRIWGDFRTRVRDGRVLDTSWTNVHLPSGCIIGIGQDITNRMQTERSLKAQAEREQLMRTVAQRIRQSLNLQDILNVTVQEVRDLVAVDRVIVYQFAADMSGAVVAESVEPGWTVSLGMEIHDTCFQTGGGQDYYQGHKRAIANIYTAGLSDCHLRLMEQFQVKANLVVPILLKAGDENTDSQLWGLLVAHQCSAPREWETHQLDLLDQLTVQIAIAIQQSSIFQQAQNELAERQKAELNLRSALAEKEVLLKEIHHRVKNNLQIVSGLLELQSQTLKDSELIKTLRETQNRIKSISLVHKNLYTFPNIGQLDIREYIQSLATSLLISYQIVTGRIALETNIDAVSLNVDQAIACGLIINELISNALKHAFTAQQSGTITISLHPLEHHIEMVIKDDGIGIPNDIDLRNTGSLGLSLVYDLVVEQLDGTIILENHHGTVFNIKFPQLISQY